MDMNVKTEAFFSASLTLKKHCKIIEAMTNVFMKKLANAKESFDDVNYDRTITSAIEVKKQIVTFSNQVSTLERDLKALETLVNAYVNGGYGK